MNKPVFTETMQIGIVVRNLDAAIQSYVNDYGIGPWDVHEFNPGNVKELREYGKPSIAHGAWQSPRSVTCSGS